MHRRGTGMGVPHGNTWLGVEVSLNYKQSVTELRLMETLA